MPGRETDRQTNRPTRRRDRLTPSQPDRQTEKQAERQTNRGQVKLHIDTLCGTKQLVCRAEEGAAGAGKQADG